ncbi:MAG: hypothetical protein CVV44_07955 [Spirochaetae bacterium HGW-Spirochaetae-1]|jgi:hypothetical protein|nr:MAG: hypothetical protein CVV44_07955 [Spirochaetae bacterium HGW-Spirochaetae-1]
MDESYKTITLDDIKLTLDVPADWKIWTRRQGGEVYYFLGTTAEEFEFDYSQVPVFSEFYTDPGKIHGVYIQTIFGTMENIDLELRVNAPKYEVISQKNLSDGTIIGKSVLMKDEWKGYYQYYAIGGNSRPGLKIETRSRLFRNEDGEMVFDDEKDKKEIDTIINSIKFN